LFNIPLNHRAFEREKSIILHLARANNFPSQLIHKLFFKFRICRPTFFGSFSNICQPLDQSEFLYLQLNHLYFNP
ncbi:hypothetical protein BDFB_013648, partial [Asbolus verrucosus]